ncbi:hypothetical protein D3C86_1305410 [compost metagenome]
MFGWNELHVVIVDQHALTLAHQAGGVDIFHVVGWRLHRIRSQSPAVGVEIRVPELLVIEIDACHAKIIGQLHHIQICLIRSRAGYRVVKAIASTRVGEGVVFLPCWTTGIDLACRHIVVFRDAAEIPAPDGDIGFDPITLEGIDDILESGKIGCGLIISGHFIGCSRVADITKQSGAGQIILRVIDQAGLNKGQHQFIEIALLTGHLLTQGFQIGQ